MTLLLFSFRICAISHSLLGLSVSRPGLSLELHDETADAGDTDQARSQLTNIYMTLIGVLAVSLLLILPSFMWLGASRGTQTKRRARFPDISSR